MSSLSGFRVLLLGVDGSGMTSFVDGLLDIDFYKKHRPTNNTSYRQVSIATTRGTLIFNICEKPTVNCCFKTVDAVIYFGDFSRSPAINLQSLYNARKYLDDLGFDYNLTPSAHVFNKCDLAYQTSSRETELITQGQHVTEMSVKHGINLKNPLLALARILLNDDSIWLADRPSSVSDESPTTIDDDQKTKTLMEKVLSRLESIEKRLDHLERDFFD